MLSESQTEKPARHEEVLTLAEAAAYLRTSEDAVLARVKDDVIPAQKIGGEWRFLKRALNDWLRYGGCRNDYPFSLDWLLESRFAEELLAILEGHLLHKLKVEASPKSGSKEAVRKHFGMWKEDATAEAMLEEIYKRRGEE